MRPGTPAPVMASGLITGWTFPDGERDALLRRFPPRWPDVVAHHVTLASHRSGPKPVPSATQGLIVGHVDDGAGVEALVVAIGGGTDRPDGAVFHITWSLDRARGRRAVESNDVIAARGWEPLPEPIPVALLPGRFWPGPL